MKKKILTISIAAAALIILASLSSVIGVTVTQPNFEKETVGSPLYAVRAQQSLNKKDNSQITTNYVGKGKVFNAFLSKRTTLDSAIERAINMLNTNPALINQIIYKLENNPKLQQILNDNKISIAEFKNELNKVKDNPEIIQKTLQDTMPSAPFNNDPIPLGLSTSSIIGCIIIAIVMLPLFLMISVLIATITIVTCLNIGGCFETLFNDLMESFIQGISPS